MPHGTQNTSKLLDKKNTCNLNFTLKNISNQTFEFNLGRQYFVYILG